MSSMDGLRAQLAELTSRVEALEAEGGDRTTGSVDLNALVTEQATRLDALEREVAGKRPTAAPATSPAASKR